MFTVCVTPASKVLEAASVSLDIKVHAVTKVSLLFWVFYCYLYLYLFLSLYC